MDADDIRALFTDGFAYIPGAMTADILQQVDLRDEVFLSFNGYHGSVRQAGWFAVLSRDDSRSSLWEIATAIEDDLVEAAESTEFAGYLAAMRFNEITIQVYRPAFGEVGPHRDQNYYSHIFAILTLHGTGLFTVHRDNQDRDEIGSWNPNPGDLFLMRAGSDGVIHSVPEPSTERISVTFRHNTQGAKSGNGGTRRLTDGGISGTELQLSAGLLNGE